MALKLTQKDFLKALDKFDRIEKRQNFYKMARKLLERGLEYEAYILILATWNFAYFRYTIKGFDIKKFTKIIEKTKNILEVELLEKLRIEDNWENNEKLKEKIENAFNLLRGWTVEIKTRSGKIRKIPIIGPTGASKILHLMNPKFFIMWDGYIRKKLGSIME